MVIVFLKQSNKQSLSFQCWSLGMLSDWLHGPLDMTPFFTFSPLFFLPTKWTELGYKY